MYDHFLEKLWNVCSEIVPHKRSRKREISRDRRILMRKRNNLYKKYKKTNGVQQKRNVTDEIKNIEAQLESSLKAERLTREKNAIKTIKSDPKYFFSYAKKRSKLKHMIGPLRVNGEMVVNPKEISDVLAKSYRDAFSTPRTNQREPTSTNLESANLLNHIQIDEEQMVAAAGGLRTGSAAGPDGVGAVLLKKCISNLKAPLSIIWQKSIRENEIPPKLKLGIITPIHKGGSKTDPKQYRPVTLTSHIIKLFERVIVKKLGMVMRERGLFNAGQHGFREGRSCLSQLLEHQQKIINILEEGDTADVVYLDFSKAFDKVDHSVLIRKLREMGVGGELLCWIENFLTDRKQVVVVDGVQSEK